MTAVCKGKGTVTYTVESGIAWLRFNPDSMQCCEIPILNRQMIRVLDEIEFDRAVGVLVFVVEDSACSTAVFSTQHATKPALKYLNANGPAHSEVQSWWTRLYTYQKPTIAMVDGFSIGEGYGPVSACDLVFTHENTQFALSDIKRGFFPVADASTATRRPITMRELLYHALSTQSINGCVAAEWGLINEALPTGLLQERVTHIARTLLGERSAALNTHCA